MIKDNLDKVLSEIKDGNNLKEKITLVGATKMVNTDTINKAISYGLNIVAENKVQEFREKTDKIVGGIQHFIGHLQTNKVKYLVGQVDVIQSVDSVNLAEEISKIAKKRNVIQKIFLEINIGKDDAKSGFYPEKIIENAKIISKLPNVTINGLMTVLPKTDNETILSVFCLQMREIYDKLNIDGFNLQYLSMGMSGDYKIAIQNGSNMIRLGSLIFGKRNYGEDK